MHGSHIRQSRKFATFFAAGGANVSWFGLLYPDADGSSHGSSGDSHNVFDCRFNRYNPRLDAITYYHTVNAIAIKRFVSEQRYPDGSRAILFRDRDQQCLIVTWTERGHRNVTLPLPGITRATHLAIDGRSTPLTSSDGGFQLTIDEHPALILFAGEAALPETLAPSSVTFLEPPATVSRHAPTTLTVAIPDSARGEDFRLRAPPRWSVRRLSPTRSRQLAFEIQPPAESAIREAEFTVHSNGDDEGGALRLSLRLPVAVGW